jgi:hypothetical protein
LPRPSHQAFALFAGRQLFGLLAGGLRVLDQALAKGQNLFETASLHARSILNAGGSTTLSVTAKWPWDGTVME